MECNFPPVMVSNSLAFSGYFSPCEHPENEEPIVSFVNCGTAVRNSPLFMTQESGFPHSILSPLKERDLSLNEDTRHGTSPERTSPKKLQSLLRSSISSVFSFESPPASPTRQRLATSEEEKRARRRHRRQLARIVVDHWMHVTRLRLLISNFGKLRQANLKRLCFRTWKIFIRHKALKCTLYKKAIKFKEHTLKRRGWQAWVAYFNFQHKLRLGSAYLSQAVGTWICKKGFTGWYDYVQKKSLHHRHLVKATQFWKLSSLSTCFVNWQLGIEKLHQRNYLRKVALGFWAHKRLSIAWKGLKLLMENRCSFNEFAEKVRQRSLRRVLQHWYMVVIEENKQSNASAIYRFNKSMLQKALIKWKTFIHLKRHSKQLKTKALLYYQHHCMSHAWEAWHDYISRRRIKYKLQVSVRSMWDRMVVRAAFSRWKTFPETANNVTEQQIMDHASSWHRQRLCSRSLSTWKERVTWKKRPKQKQAAILHLRVCCAHKAFQTIKMCFPSHQKESCRSIPKQSSHLYVDVALSPRTVSQWYQEAFREGRKQVHTSRMKTRRTLFTKKVLQVCKGGGSSTKRWNSFKGTKQAGKIYSMHKVLDSRWVKSLLTSQAKVFYKKCLQELKLPAWQEPNKLRNSSSQNTSQPICAPSREEVCDHTFKPTSRVRLPPRVPAYFFHDIQGQSGPRNLHDQIYSGQHKSDSGHEFQITNINRDCIHRVIHGAVSENQGNKNLRNSTAQICKDENLPNYGGKALSSLNKLTMRTDTAKSGAKKSTSVGTSALSRLDVKVMDRLNSTKSVDLSDRKLIAEEIQWMEQLLQSFEDLRVEILQRQAQRALLWDGCPVANEEETLLGQKIVALQQRRAVLLPSIQAIAKRTCELHMLWTGTKMAG